MLQLGELGARERDPPLLRAEVHQHGLVFHAEDDAEPVLIVGHLIVDVERLGRGRRRRGRERAAGQMAPGRGAGCVHSYHHAPSMAGPASPRGHMLETRTACALTLAGITSRGSAGGAATRPAWLALALP